MSPRYTLRLFRAMKGEGPVYDGKAIYVLVTEKNKSCGICMAASCLMWALLSSCSSCCGYPALGPDHAELRRQAAWDPARILFLSGTHHISNNTL